MKDYPEWKKEFDIDAVIRKKVGSRGGHLFRNAADQNDVFVLLEWDSSENAKRFIESEDLQTVMKKAGAIGRPDVHFLDQGEKFSP